MNATEYRALQEKLDQIAQPLKEDDDKPAYDSPEEDEILKKLMNSLTSEWSKSLI